MFVEYITLDHTRLCIAESGKIVVVGKPSRAIDAVLPLLNALLPNVTLAPHASAGVSYNPRASALVLRRKPGFITLLADTIYITQVKDADEGLGLLDALRDLLNQTWERRDELQPRNEERRAPRPLDVYALLPQTNCRLCGEITCMAFGFALLDTRRRVEECMPLREPNASAQRETLHGLLGNYEATNSVWRQNE
jgi:ArsR family metal-binding transcriptional regulator